MPGEFPPVFPGTTRRYLAFFGGVNAFSPRIRGISARIPCNSSRTAAAAITVRDRAFSGPSAAFRPRLFPPAAGRLARPACLAVRPRGHPRGRGPGREGRGKGGEGGKKYIHGEGNHRENKYGSSFACRADYDCFTSYARTQSWSPLEGLIWPLPAHSAGLGGSSVDRNREWTPDWQGVWNGDWLVGIRST